MKRWMPWIVGVFAVTAICWIFPPFHLRSLPEMRETRAGAQFNAGLFAEQFWTEQLLASLDRAVAAEKVLAAIATAPSQVRERFGRTVGISSSYYLFLHGLGRVVSVDEESVGLSLRANSAHADVVVPLGLVFGNAVRDGTGLLESGAFPNSQDYNAIAAALNELVETRVLEELQREAAVGQWLRFAGCAEVADEEFDLEPLRLVPVLVRIERTE
jgi:predicted lipoprotein